MFYVFGGLGCVWYALWMTLFSSSPAEDKWISAEERTYIEANLSPPAESGKAAGGNVWTQGDDVEKESLIADSSAGDDATPPVPWKSIFTSSAVWACKQPTLFATQP